MRLYHGKSDQNNRFTDIDDGFFHVHRQSSFRSKNDASVLDPSALKRPNCKTKGLSNAQSLIRSRWRYGSGSGQSVLGSPIQITLYLSWAFQIFEMVNLTIFFRYSDILNFNNLKPYWRFPISPHLLRQMPFRIDDYSETTFPCICGKPLKIAQLRSYIKTLRFLEKLIF